MNNSQSNFGTANIPFLFFKLAPPVMFSLLIQSIYNVVDSYFVAKFDSSALTALSIIYPIQLLMIAIATGTGAGANILISIFAGQKNISGQNKVAINTLFLGILNYVAFTIFALMLLHPFYELSVNIPKIQHFGSIYGHIILIFSFSMFIEANFTKMLQAKGKMYIPMMAQIAGAGINIFLNPLLIFGKCGLPEMGIAGSAISTVVSQTIALIIVSLYVRKYYSFSGKLSLKLCLQIYKKGSATIIMQSLYTFYIVGLNFILKSFSVDAVNVLGIYYKIQTFFFIPLEGLQQVLLPLLSFNYAAKLKTRLQETMKLALIATGIIMAVATFIFFFFSKELLNIYSTNRILIQIGNYAFKAIGLSFIPGGISMILAVFFQATSHAPMSIIVTVLREVILLVPLAYFLSRFGLNYFWWSFPITELVTVSVALFCFIKSGIRSSDD